SSRKPNSMVTWKTGSAFLPTNPRMPLTLNQSILRRVCEALFNPLRTACCTLSSETPTISITSYVFSAIILILWLRNVKAGSDKELAFEPEAHLDGDLEDRLGVILDHPADLGHIEPVDVAQGLRSL